MKHIYDGSKSHYMIYLNHFNFCTNFTRIVKRQKWHYLSERLVYGHFLALSSTAF